MELLGPKALDRRVGLGVRWAKYVGGGGRRLRGHTSDVMAISECKGRVCSGSLDGTIRVWSMLVETAVEPERTLESEGPKDGVYSLSAWRGRLISGHGSGKLRMWNVATGACEQVLEGHAPQCVWALALCGSRLVSSSSDRSIKVWAMGEAAPWTCERTLLGHTDRVPTLATWQGKVLSGSDDRSIRVWDVETGEHAATLGGIYGLIIALVVHRDRLYSAASDGTVQVWALGTWAALPRLTQLVFGRGPGQCAGCLAVSGSQLVHGSSMNGGENGVVLVWSLETLDLHRALEQPAASCVTALLAVDGAVWAGVGGDVVTWAA